MNWDLVLLFLIGGLLFIIAFWWLNSGKVKPYVDGEGRLLPQSISEKVFIDINGVKQGMFIKGKNVNNPILLYLHGGMPDYFLTQKYPTGLEDYFTVVWWEQRGAGISYKAEILPETITLDRLIADTVAVTNYLRQRFNKEKIFLMGHSGGTFIGIHVVAQMPQLYEAYIGVAQISNQLKSEKIAYDYMIQKFQEIGDSEMIQKLKQAPVTMTNATPSSYTAIRDQAMHSLGIGTIHKMNSVIRGIFLPSLIFREYTLMEKINLWRAKSSTGISVLWKTILETDLNKKILTIDIPIYFFHGKYDYTVSYLEAKNYFENIRAPVKGFYTFEQSAHSPMFEEPEKMQKIIKEDILLNRNNFADGR